VTWRSERSQPLQHHSGTLALTHEWQMNEEAREADAMPSGSASKNSNPLRP
jgi:hypothetical protein